MAAAAIIIEICCGVFSPAQAKMITMAITSTTVSMDLITIDKVRFTIVDLNTPRVATFKSVFADLPQFTVEKSNILSIPADCIVSPANSKGLMDGGVDGPINYALDHIDTRIVRPRIMKEFFGEQPVGTCMIVPTGVTRYPFLAHTPTMRTPEDVSDTHNAYTAMRALLRKIAQYNEYAVSIKSQQIKTVLLTPFCTGAGNMTALQSAKQMHLAYVTMISPTDCSWEGMGAINRALAETGY